MNELAPSSAPQKKRSRRRLVAVILLTLIAVGTWAWNRPQVDARFAGKWEGWGRSVPPNFMMFDLRPDGTGTYSAKYWQDIDYTILATSAPRPLSWWVRGDEIHYQLTSQEPGSLQRFWHALVRRFTGSNLASFRVIQVDGQQLVLRYLRQNDQNDSTHDFKLERSKP